MSITVGLLLMANIVLITVAVNANARMAELDLSREKSKQRAAALGDIINDRSSTQVYSYNKACEYAKEKGQACLVNTKWYADPDKYPLIAHDPMGVGLFPPEQPVACCETETKK